MVGVTRVYTDALSNADVQRLHEIFSENDMRAQLFAPRPNLPLDEAVDNWMQPGADTRLGTLRLSDGRLVGGIRLDGPELAYFVDPAFKRQGFGKSLFLWMEREVLPKLLQNLVFADTVRENVASVGLLTSFGFEFAGFSPEAWPRVNALRYVRRL